MTGIFPQSLVGKRDNWRRERQKKEERLGTERNASIIHLSPTITFNECIALYRHRVSPQSHLLGFDSALHAYGCKAVFTFTVALSGRCMKTRDTSFLLEVLSNTAAYAKQHGDWRNGGLGPYLR